MNTKHLIVLALVLIGNNSFAGGCCSSLASKKKPQVTIITPRTVTPRSRTPSSERRKEIYLVARDITPPGAHRVLERNAALAVKRIKSEGEWVFAEHREKDED